MMSFGKRITVASGLVVENFYLSIVASGTKKSILGTTKLYHIPLLVCGCLVQVPFSVFWKKFRIMYMSTQSGTYEIWSKIPRFWVQKYHDQYNGSCISELM